MMNPEMMKNTSTPASPTRMALRWKSTTVVAAIARRNWIEWNTTPPPG